MENAGVERKKRKSQKSIETPKFSSVFNLPPQQLWSKNCRTAILWIFVGHQVIHSKSAQIIGNFDNGEWKKCPTKRPVSKLPNFYRATSLQQGSQTCIRCARKNSSRYKLHSENEIISTVIGLKLKFFRNFRRTWRSLSKNFLAALSEPKFSCPSVYFAKSIFLRHLFNFENLLDFNKKNTVLRVQRIFSWNLCFFPI